MFAKMHALSDPTRWAILRLVRDRECPAGVIAGHFKTLTRPAVSQHLRILKHNALLVERREGTKRLYRLNPDGIEEVRRFLYGFWEGRLEALKHAAEQDASAATPARRSSITPSRITPSRKGKNHGSFKKQR
ncbi:MAG: metalloregulator ArsR/SmtB family transcription factor [Pseudomonadota bacterium]